MTKADTMLNYARQFVGKPYRLGARGPDEWDCSGLTLMAARQIGLKLYHGATTQWRRGHEEGAANAYGYWSASGTIDTLPMDKFAFLYNADKSQSGVMAHTGIYDGNGRVVQAGGQYPGVSDMPINKKRWSHWATLKGVDNVETGLRRGSEGIAVKVLQSALIKLGYDLGQWAADGKFGAQTESAVKAFQAKSGLPATGVWTPADNAALNAALNSGEPVDRAALVTEAVGHLERLTAIVKALGVG